MKKPLLDQIQRRIVREKKGVFAADSYVALLNRKRFEREFGKSDLYLKINRFLNFFGYQLKSKL